MCFGSSRSQTALRTASAVFFVLDLLVDAFLDEDLLEREPMFLVDELLTVVFEFALELVLEARPSAAFVISVTLELRPALRSSITMTFEETEIEQSVYA